MCLLDKVAVCIAEVLESNCSLQILTVHSNQIGNTGLDRITMLLEALRELYLVYIVWNMQQQWMIRYNLSYLQNKQEKGLHLVNIIHAWRQCRVVQKFSPTSLFVSIVNGLNLLTVYPVISAACLSCWLFLFTNFVYVWCTSCCHSLN